MLLYFSLPRKFFEKYFFVFFTLVTISFAGCSKNNANSISTPNYVNPNGERKFSTLESPFGNYKPLLVIYTSNKKSYLWFMLAPLGIYTSNERAEIIANSLEKYRKEKMSEIEWGTKNSEQIICVRTEKLPNDCQQILTIPPDKTVEEILISCEM